jgi:hypothetical protein
MKKSEKINFLYAENGINVSDPDFLIRDEGY